MTLNKLVKYNTKANWSDVIDDNNKNFIEKLDKPLDEIDFSFEKTILNLLKIKEDKDISTINFSLNNEKIMNKLKDIIINKIPFKKQISLQILRKQNFIITYLSKYIVQNKKLDYDFFVKLLLWLKMGSNELAKRLKMEKITHNIPNINKLTSIPRSSYKFCSYKHECNYNYDNKNRGCYADHYVHNVLVSDIEVLLIYLKTNYNKQLIMPNKEIIKSINTISFVIKNMYDELSNMSYYSISKDLKTLESYHVNKHIDSKNKRKKNYSRKRR
jgi:hypothetical protein